MVGRLRLLFFQSLEKLGAGSVCLGADALVAAGERNLDEGNLAGDFVHLCLIDFPLNWPGNMSFRKGEIKQ